MERALVSLVLALVIVGAAQSPAQTNPPSLWNSHARIDPARFLQPGPPSSLDPVKGDSE